MAIVLWCTLFGTHGVLGAYPSNDAALEVIDLYKYALVDQLLGIPAAPNSNSAADTDSG